MTKASPSSESPNDLVLEYLKKQNRPYNATDIHSSLKGKIQKTKLVKALEELHSQDLINGRTYGKQIIYCSKQEEAIDKSKVEELEGDIRMLTQECEALKTSLKENSRELNSLQNMKSVEELRDILDKLSNDNERLQNELNELRSAGVQVNENADKIHEEYLEYYQEWKSRRKMFYNIWDTVMENYEGDSKKLLTKLGIETDKDAKVNLKDFV